MAKTGYDDKYSRMHFDKDGQLLFKYLKTAGETKSPAGPEETVEQDQLQDLTGLPDLDNSIILLYGNDSFLKSPFVSLYNVKPYSTNRRHFCVTDLSHEYAVNDFDNNARYKCFADWNQSQIHLNISGVEKFKFRIRMIPSQSQNEETNEHSCSILGGLFPSPSPSSRGNDEYNIKESLEFIIKHPLNKERPASYLLGPPLTEEEIILTL
ncbi:hypothetical protein CHS0354_030199 [Potamilus streckersoni]|uniref:Uncharacterized protein n=1 Tax=Potamilus streckersoni TaxID=2493646 RepID=A0AAE0RSA7_9BIVA|nr:hypothetical protein CHS0354_030199 [Potamilus streckersoni]